MRKLILLVVLTGLSAGIFAQSLEDIEKYVALQRWEEAKGLLEKFLAVEKNSKVPKAWYYKGYIYEELAKLPNYAGTEIRMDAFNAFKKYQEMDPTNALMKADENLDLFGLYNAYFDDAATKYNSKKYDLAFKSFRNALTVEDYIKGKGFSYKGYSFPALDTQLLQNTALSAYLGKDSVNAAIYYQKIADAKVKGDAYLEIYQFLVEFFEVKMDATNRDKYFAIGRELYPDNEYWLDYEWKAAGNDKQKKEAVLAKYPNSYSLHYNYAAELFNSLYTGDQKPADYAGVQAKLESVAKKAIAIKSGPEANLLLARHFYNEIYDLDDAILAVKGTKPDDVKKKTDLVGQLNRKYDEMLPYAMAVFNNFDGKTGLKPGERGNFKIAINLLLSYWENKKDAAKIKEYQDKMKSTE